MTGKKLVHKKYGDVISTHVQRKLINPENGTTEIVGVTFEILDAQQHKLFNESRNIYKGLQTKDLPRCYESDLTQFVK